MTKELILNYGIQLLFTGVVALLGISNRALLTKIQKNKVEAEEIRKKSLAIEEGLMSLLYFSLRQECKTILTRGTITHQELKDLEHFYSAYKGLNGNGVITKLFEDCKRLDMDTEGE